MWFRNLTVLRAPKPWALDRAALETALQPLAFTEAMSVETQRMGWTPPREGHTEPVYALADAWLIALRQEKKLLPTRVVQQFVRERAVEIEAEEGFKLSRKRLRALKDEVRDQLLPRAFSIATDTRAWIDAPRGLLVIDAAQASRADEVVGLLARSLGSLPVRPLQTRLSPVAAMTDWLASDEAPAGFSLDQEATLKASDSPATLRYAHLSMEAEEIARHTRAGKRCTRLAMTWRDRVSFVLTDTLAIKRVKPLDVLREAEGGGADETDAEARFAADFALMTAEVSALLEDLFDALGGPA